PASWVSCCGIRPKCEVRIAAKGNPISLTTACPGKVVSMNLLPRWMLAIHRLALAALALVASGCGAPSDAAATPRPQPRAERQGPALEVRMGLEQLRNPYW